MINKKIFSIFHNGSKTYFYSSLFFPSSMKKDVFSLYAFVRKADNYVDAIPQDINGFYRFKDTYHTALQGKKSGNVVIDSFVDLAKRKRFDPLWTDAFFDSMQSDITTSRYDTIDSVINYMYGSAEVIGLYMAKIMDLPSSALHHARYLGRAMQYVNFIRDIAEDLTLNRIYMPAEEMKRYGISCLDFEYVKNIPSQFSDFIRKQLQYYTQWLDIAEKGFRYIPKRYLIPIKTATDMYTWTAEQIYKNPFIVFQRQIKPHFTNIVSSIIQNLIDPRMQKERSYESHFHPNPIIDQ